MNLWQVPNVNMHFDRYQYPLQISDLPTGNEIVAIAASPKFDLMEPLIHR